MKIIVHKIRLTDIAHLEAFHEWVVNTDYVACESLPSVVQFDVAAVSVEPSAPFHFIEVIRITDEEAFNRDMDTPLFQSLVARFSEMAEVIEETVTELIGEGYVDR